MAVYKRRKRSGHSRARGSRRMRGGTLFSPQMRPKTKSPLQKSIEIFMKEYNRKKANRRGQQHEGVVSFHPG